MNPDPYINLLKASLTGLISSDLKQVKYENGLPIVTKQNDAYRRYYGLDWPAYATTMIGIDRLENIEECVKTVIKDNIPGHLIETGVWRGGATIFMRGLLKAYDVDDRFVFVADSFEGLPKPDSSYPLDKDDRHHEVSYLVATLPEVIENFKRFDLYDEQVRFVKGFFKDTLRHLWHNKWSVIRLDGDMYESTMVALQQLYPNLQDGGFIIIDDYGALPNCRKAVHDYRDRHGITDEIKDIDWTGVYWRKNRS